MKKPVFALLLLISAFPLQAARDLPGSVNILYLGDRLFEHLTGVR